MARPSEYVAFMLSLLGDDDPAEVQAATPAALRELAARAGDDIRTRPAEGEWSVVELIGHLTDAELVAGGRYRWVLAHDGPTLTTDDLLDFHLLLEQPDWFESLLKVSTRS